MTAKPTNPARLNLTLLAALALAMLSCLPVLLAATPQMGDYAAHMARYHVMLDGGQSADLARHYTFQWKWVGNLGADLLVRPLAALFGLEPAGRLIAGIMPVLIGLGIIAVEWALHRRIGVGAFLALAFIWAPPQLMGFLNYGLSLALALFAFALWVWLDGKRWRWALFLPIGIAAWLAHVSGWGVLGIMVFGYEWSRGKNWRAFIAPWPLTMPALPLLFGGGAKGALSWGPHVWIYKWAIWQRAMRDVDYWLDTASLLIVLAVLVLAFVTRRIDGRLGWAALILLAGSIAMPRSIFGGDYADYRLISAGLMLGCLAIDWRDAPRLALWCAPLLFLVRLGVTAENWLVQGRQADVLLTALDHIPQGASVASVVMVQRGRWSFDPREHISGWAVVHRNALVNSNFAVRGVHMMQLREPLDHFVDPSHRMFTWPGQHIDLARFRPAAHAQYLWYVGEEEPAVLPSDAQVIYRTPGSLLARLANPRGAR